MQLLGVWRQPAADEVRKGCIGCLIHQRMWLGLKLVCKSPQPCRHCSSCVLGGPRKTGTAAAAAISAGGKAGAFATARLGVCRVKQAIAPGKPWVQLGSAQSQQQSCLVSHGCSWEIQELTAVCVRSRGMHPMSVHQNSTLSRIGIKKTLKFK
eukprot:898426-Pelagomonas_calceolata.AAC.2